MCFVWDMNLRYNTCSFNSHVHCTCVHVYTCMYINVYIDETHAEERKETQTQQTPPVKHKPTK